jgi:hypothetical protein
VKSFVKRRAAVGVSGWVVVNSSNKIKNTKTNTMKKSGLLLALFAMMIFFTSCEKVVGEGPVQTETRNPGPFSGIDVRIPGTINYTQGASYSVQVSAQRNILDILETYVSDGKLILRFENSVSVRNHDRITVNITAPSQSLLRLSGSGNIFVTGPFTPSNLDLEVSGSGNINIQQLVTNFIDANISGSGNIRVESGTSAEERLRISGSGNIDVADVVSAKVKTTTSGSGYMKLRASQELDVTISGSGSVYYRGTPIVRTSISGSGRVEPW